MLLKRFAQICGVPAVFQILASFFTKTLSILLKKLEGVCSIQYILN